MPGFPADQVLPSVSLKSVIWSQKFIKHYTTSNIFKNKKKNSDINSVVEESKYSIIN